MKIPGEIVPFFGSTQRASASTLAMVPEMLRITGWKYTWIHRLSMAFWKWSIT